MENVNVIQDLQVTFVNFMYLVTVIVHLLKMDHAKLMELVYVMKDTKVHRVS